MRFVSGHVWKNPQNQQNFSRQFLPAWCRWCSTLAACQTFPPHHYIYVLSHLTTPRDSDVWRHATRQQVFCYLMVRHSLPCRGWSYLLPPLWCWGRWARLCSPPGCRVLHTPLRTSRWPHWPLLLSSHHFMTLSRDDRWVDHCTK